MKIYNYNIDLSIRVREILLIFCFLLFTVLMNYVNVSPYIKEFARKNRLVQLLAIFIISLTFIMSFQSSYKIKFNYIFNSLIVTLLFSFLTKPKNEVGQELDVIDNTFQHIKNNLKKNPI